MGREVAGEGGGGEEGGGLREEGQDEGREGGAGSGRCGWKGRVGREVGREEGGEAEEVAELGGGSHGWGMWKVDTML